MKNQMEVYEDIAKRTNGEIYLGVCGPVRTGKSTFIKKFMELMVLPGIVQETDRARAIDELPQSADGFTVMTTEPKFIPKEAVEVALPGEVHARVRMIDCVGYMVPGAQGDYEDGKERMVKTPWSEQAMPFSEAAEMGTRKVITDHSTIGIIVTTDGSFSALPRSAYLSAEERTIQELKEVGKPFVVIVNSSSPTSETAEAARKQIEQRYQVPVMVLDASRMLMEQVHQMMGMILDSFPVTRVCFELPSWVEMLELDHWLKQEAIQAARTVLDQLHCIGDVRKVSLTTEQEHITEISLRKISMEDGSVMMSMVFAKQMYYQILGDLVGMPISGEYELIRLLGEYVRAKTQTSHMMEAWEDVRSGGYGVVLPEPEDIEMDSPQLIQQGHKYGVKIKAVSPSIHLIQADIETEIAPIVGSQEQAEDLLRYIESQKQEGMGIWDTNIFGKTVGQLVEEGIHHKVNRLTQESQKKLQGTMQKVINDSNGGLVCIII